MSAENLSPEVEIEHTAEIIPFPIVKKLPQPKVVFGYFDLKVPDKANADTIVGTGHITVALQYPTRSQPVTDYKVAVAFGFPKDNDNRRKAREIAMGRLQTPRPDRAFNLKVDADKVKDLDFIFDLALKTATSESFQVVRKNHTTTYAPRFVLDALAAGCLWHVPPSPPLSKKTK